MAAGDLQRVAARRASPDRERIARRVAAFGEPAPLCCLEEGDRAPKVVQPLNAGFFKLEAMRRANVAQTKQRGRPRAKVRVK